MPVSLSLVAGAAAQFLDNNGNPLAAGKLYTYLAGTSTPVATYTTSAGTIAHTNPIVLDAGGRVPYGEIWLTSGSSYKFVLQDSASNLVATWDNIPSISSALNGSGTNNAVPYFNSSGVFTSGSNLTFNGTDLTVAGAVNSATLALSGNAVVTGTIASTGGITSATPAVTQSASDSSTKIATTQFVKKYAPSAKIQPITATTASGAITITINPTYLDFRNSSATSGAVDSVEVPTALTLTVPSGTALGAYSTFTLVGGTGGVSSTTLTVASTSGTILPGQVITGTGIVGTVTILNQLTGTTGSTGTYTMSSAQTISTSTTITSTFTSSPARLVVLAVNNGGTVIPAVTNILGGANLDETSTITTTNATAGSTVATVLSTASVTAPYRVVGFIDVANSVGAWGSPTKVQGTGGQPLASMSSLGYGQTCQSVVSSRALGTFYYNTTGKPIAVFGSNTNTSGGRQVIIINGLWAGYYTAASGATDMPFSFIVPVGGSYAIITTAGTMTTNVWMELR